MVQLLPEKANVGSGAAAVKDSAGLGIDHKMHFAAILGHPVYLIDRFAIALVIQIGAQLVAAILLLQFIENLAERHRPPLIARIARLTGRELVHPALRRRGGRDDEAECQKKGSNPFHTLPYKGAALNVK